MKIMWIVGVLILMISMDSVSFGKNNSQGLNLTIATDKNLYTSAESIKCTLALRNISKRTLTVNERLLLNYDATFPHEVLFNIIAPDGKLLELIPIIKASLPKPRDFTTLAPSKFLMKTFELTQYFSFAQQGKYRIQAVYENHHQPENMVVWTGNIKSNLTEIEIIR